MSEKESKGTIHKVWEKVKQFGTEAYEKGKEYTAITELKIKINSFNKEKHNLYGEIGECVFDLMERKETKLEEKTEIKARYDKICAIKEKISNLEFEIDKIKQEHDIDDEELEPMVKKETEQKSKEEKAPPRKKAGSSPKKSTAQKKPDETAKKNSGAKKS